MIYFRQGSPARHFGHLPFAATLKKKGQSALSAVCGRQIATQARVAPLREVIATGMSWHDFLAGLFCDEPIFHGYSMGALPLLCLAHLGPNLVTQRRGEKCLGQAAWLHES